MKQESAQQHRGPVVAKQPLAIGFVIDRMVKRLSDTNREKVLSLFADPELQATHRLIISELQQMMGELSVYDYIDDDEFGKVRTQVVAVSSILSACNELGRKHAEQNHPLNQAAGATETPIVE